MVIFVPDCHLYLHLKGFVSAFLSFLFAVTLFCKSVVSACMSATISMSNRISMSTTISVGFSREGLRPERQKDGEGCRSTAAAEASTHGCFLSLAEWKTKLCFCYSWKITSVSLSDLVAKDALPGLVNEKKVMYSLGLDGLKLPPWEELYIQGLLATCHW